MSKEADILIVDDEPDLLELLSIATEIAGFESAKASSGRKAQEYLKSHQVKLIVSDIRMNDGDGIELLKAVKGGANPPPIMLMTGYADLSPRNAYHLGACGFIEKPFEIEKILKQISLKLSPSPDVLISDSQKQKYLDTSLALNLKLDDAPFDRNNAQIRFGAGGFSVRCPEFPIGDQRKIAFALTSGNGSFRLTGWGDIRWVELDEGEDHILGIEYGYLEPESLALIKAKGLLEGVSYIPSFDSDGSV